MCPLFECIAVQHAFDELVRAQILQPLIRPGHVCPMGVGVELKEGEAIRIMLGEVVGIKDPFFDDTVPGKTVQRST